MVELPKDHRFETSREVGTVLDENMQGLFQNSLKFKAFTEVLL